MARNSKTEEQNEPEAQERVPADAKPETTSDDGMRADIERAAGSVYEKVRAAKQDAIDFFLASNIRPVAERFAEGILTNPQAERFLAGNPLDGHKISDDRPVSVGVYLARRTFELASDYLGEMEHLIQVDQRRRARERVNVTDDPGSNGEPVNAGPAAA